MLRRNGSVFLFLFMFLGLLAVLFWKAPSKISPLLETPQEPVSSEVLFHGRLKPLSISDLYVIENSAERAEKFKNEYNLNYNWDIRNAEKLEEILYEKRERTNRAIDEEFLISASAYYGELIIKNFGGKWVFDISEDEDYEGYSEIQKIAEQYSKTIIFECPLALIMNYYSSPNFFRHKLIYQFDKLDSWIKEEKENNK